jgi:hypothetical protein
MIVTYGAACIGDDCDDVPVCTEILCSDYVQARCNDDPCDIAPNDYNCEEGDSCTCRWEGGDDGECNFAKAVPVCDNPPCGAISLS